MKKWLTLSLLVLSIALLTACEEENYEEEDDYMTNAGIGIVDNEGSNALDGENSFTDDDMFPIEDGTVTWLDELTTYVEEEMETTGMPGVAIAIIEGQETIFAQGFGWRDVEAKQPVTSDTLFHIGSTHKSMTSMLIATLVDDEVLAWDVPIVEFIPEFELSDPDATEQVTIRHLLNMTSGIPDEAEEDLDLDGTPEDVFALAAEADLLGLPGEAYSYSNPSASLAGYIGVLANGGTWNDLYDGYARLLHERILDPIGMDHATIYASQAQQNPLMSRSYTLDTNGEPVRAEVEDVDVDILAPSGSLKASVEEMALYVSTQMNAGIAPNGNRVVSAQNLQETHQPYLENYALGWEIVELEGLTVIKHEGSFDNFVSVIGFFPEKNIGFVILVNSEEAGSEFIEHVPQVIAELISG